MRGGARHSGTNCRGGRAGASVSGVTAAESTEYVGKCSRAMPRTLLLISAIVSARVWWIRGKPWTAHLCRGGPWAGLVSPALLLNDRGSPELYCMRQSSVQGWLRAVWVCHALPRGGLLCSKTPKQDRVDGRISMVM